MLNYDLGEMRGKDGSSLRYEVEARAGSHAIEIARWISQTRLYAHLNEKLPTPRLRSYFSFIIKNEIYAYIRQACIIEYLKKNNGRIDLKDTEVLAPKTALTCLLNKFWAFSDVSLRLLHPFFYYRAIGFSMKGTLRSILKPRVQKYKEDIRKFLNNSHDHNFSAGDNLQQPCIACHFVEGLEYSRRNDLNWYQWSGIAPSRILIYFDSYYSKTGKPIEKRVIQEIEARGFRWVALKKNIIEGYATSDWVPAPLGVSARLRCRLNSSAIDKWIVGASNDLLLEVNYWYCFFEHFNVKINYVPEEGSLKNIAQSIAFDIGKKERGVLIGKQRSELYMPVTTYLGHHPKHLFYAWNKRAGNYLNSSSEHIETFVVTGYPYEISKKDINYCAELKASGVHFVIALFDNAYGTDVHFSKHGIESFYRIFLEWCINDSDIGLILKPKKPFTIEGLTSMCDLLNDAMKTGRCVRVEREWGRYPSDVSFGADMAVGVGISSAVTEAVIAGCRGLHYDMTAYMTHAFYKCGHKKIIFDNLNEMISMLKKYKNDPTSIPGLGDWSDFMYLLDSFCDGKGQERMGVHMRYMLECYSKKMAREDAITEANGKYAMKWGKDKIITRKNSPT